MHITAYYFSTPTYVSMALKFWGSNKKSASWSTMRTLGEC